MHQGNSGHVGVSVLPGYHLETCAQQAQGLRDFEEQRDRFG